MAFIRKARRQGWIDGNAETGDYNWTPFKKSEMAGLNAFCKKHPNHYPLKKKLALVKPTPIH